MGRGVVFHTIQKYINFGVNTLSCCFKRYNSRIMLMKFFNYSIEFVFLWRFWLCMGNMRLIWCLYGYRWAWQWVDRGNRNSSTPFGNRRSMSSLFWRRVHHAVKVGYILNWCLICFSRDDIGPAWFQLIYTTKPYPLDIINENLFRFTISDNLMNFIL